jgi:hypothetical protein
MGEGAACSTQRLHACAVEEIAVAALSSWPK